MYFGYGIVEMDGFEVGWLGADQEGLSLCLIHEGRIALLCSEMDQDNAGSRDSMRLYTDVLCRIIKQTTIIPLRFGTMFDDEQEIKDNLRQGEGTYKKLLGKFADHIEVELKVWWKKESFEQTILADKQLSRWKKALETTAGKGYDMVEFGKAIQAAADLAREKLAKVFLTRLRPLATDYVLKDPVDEFQAFDGVFLVHRSKEEEFDNAVGVLHEREPGKFIFKYTGPWAPHHFVT